MIFHFREKYQLDWPFDDKEFTSRNMQSSSEIPSLVPSTLDNVTMDTAVHKIRKFLVAGTAKDCSLLLAIQPTEKMERWEGIDWLFKFD